MPLRIVLDARRVADFGIGTYIRNLVRSLARLDQENRYILITSAASVPEFADLPENFQTTVHSRKSRSGLAQIGFSYFLRTLDADLFHIPLNAVPLWMPKPYLVTTHDMSTLLFIDQSGYRSNLRRFHLRRGLLHADRVIAVSSATRRDVESVLGIPSSRIRVVYNAPDPVFYAHEASPWPLPAANTSPTLPTPSACWTAITSTTRFCFTWAAPMLKKTSPAWWKLSPSCAERFRTALLIAISG